MSVRDESIILISISICVTYLSASVINESKYSTLLPLSVISVLKYVIHLSISVSRLSNHVSILVMKHPVRLSQSTEQKTLIISDRNIYLKLVADL